MCYVKDKNVKSRKINGKWCGVHLFTEEVLFIDGEFISEKLSNFTVKRLQNYIKITKEFERVQEG